MMMQSSVILLATCAQAMKGGMTLKRARSLPGRAQRSASGASTTMTIRWKCDCGFVWESPLTELTSCPVEGCSKSNKVVTK